MAAKFTFFDGLKVKVDLDRMVEFEDFQVKKYFSGESVDTANIYEDLGPFIMDFTNYHPSSEEIEDITDKSIRIFSIWAEETATRKVCLIAKGFFALSPFELAATTYYDMTEKSTLFYPMAILSSFRTNYVDHKEIDTLVKEAMLEINQIWRRLRIKTINRLIPGSELWRRFHYTIDKIIHFTLMCPSMDRELIEALRGKGFRTTGVMQLLSAPVDEYSKAALEDHLRKAQELTQGSLE